MTNDEIFWGAVAELHDRRWLDRFAAHIDGAPVVGRQALVEEFLKTCPAWDGKVHTKAQDDAWWRRHLFTATVHALTAPRYASRRAW